MSKKKKKLISKRFSHRFIQVKSKKETVQCDIKTRKVEYEIKKFEIEFGFPVLTDIKDPIELLTPGSNIELKRFSIDIEIKKKSKTKSRKKLNK